MGMYIKRIIVNSKNIFKNRKRNKIQEDNYSSIKKIVDILFKILIDQKALHFDFSWFL